MKGVKHESFAVVCPLTHRIQRVIRFREKLSTDFAASPSGKRNQEKLVAFFEK